MKILKPLVCISLIALTASCENKKTREEIEADFKNIDRTEMTEEEILTYEQQKASMNENTEAFKRKELLDEEEENRKKEAEKKEKKQAESDVTYDEYEADEDAETAIAAEPESDILTDSVAQ